MQEKRGDMETWGCRGVETWRARGHVEMEAWRRATGVRIRRYGGKEV